MSEESEFIDRHAEVISDGMLVSKWSGALGVDMATLPAEERKRIAKEIIDMRKWLTGTFTIEILHGDDPRGN